MPLEDSVRIRHVLEAAQSASRFCEGMHWEDFQSDERTSRAVIQCIEVIGEAARNVTDQTRLEIPGVPWRQLVGMRHRVAHAYFDINLKLVWEVVAKDLSPLISSLQDWESKQAEKLP